jgi:hypothetical protein
MDRASRRRACARPARDRHGSARRACESQGALAAGDSVVERPLWMRILGRQLLAGQRPSAKASSRPRSGRPGFWSAPETTNAVLPSCRSPGQRQAVRADHSLRLKGCGAARHGNREHRLRVVGPHFNVTTMRLGNLARDVEPEPQTAVFALRSPRSRSSRLPVRHGLRRTLPCAERSSIRTSQVRTARSAVPVRTGFPARRRPPRVPARLSRTTTRSAPKAGASGGSRRRRNRALAGLVSGELK